MTSPATSSPKPVSPQAHALELRPAATLRSGRWVAKRALIGLLLLAMFAAGGSALLYASIEPEAPTAAGE